MRKNQSAAALEVVVGEMAGNLNANTAGAVTNWWLKC